jgi:Flp pilus assembly protein TadD
MLEAAVVKASAQQGPDEWAQALLTLELAAAAARDAGDWQLADQVAQKMLEHFPTYAGAHNALGLVAAQKGDRALARTAFTRAEKYWSQADPDLRELATLRGWLKANPAR